MRIIFDMDGTIADLYHVDNWLEKLRAEDASPYEEAEPMCDMATLRKMLYFLRLYGHEVIVVSWLSRESTKDYNRATRKAKRDWLRAQGLYELMDEIHLVKYGTPKSKYLNPDTINFMIDDSMDVAKDVCRKPNAVHINPENIDIVEFLRSFFVNEEEEKEE